MNCKRLTPDVNSPCFVAPHTLYCRVNIVIGSEQLGAGRHLRSEGAGGQEGRRAPVYLCSINLMWCLSLWAVWFTVFPEPWPWSELGQEICHRLFNSGHNSLTTKTQVEINNMSTLTLLGPGCSWLFNSFTNSQFLLGAGIFNHCSGLLKAFMVAQVQCLFHHRIFLTATVQWLR